MDVVLIVLVAVVLLVTLNGLLFWRLSKRGLGHGEPGLLLLQNQIQDLSRVVEAKLGENARQMHESVRTQLGESSRLIKEVTEELAHVKDTGRRVEGFAAQLQKLQDVLQNPKQRGILGEYYLETLLKNVFPPGMYQMQYPFRDGAIVDAVIFIKEKIIPIDSKFSLENYNRIIEEKDPLERERLEKIFKQDLKNRIDETAKYVRPEEGTMDFAFMFIPAEGIYYDLLVNQVGAMKTNTRDLIEYAFIEKKVHIVSPTTFLSHLKMILQGLRALQIEEDAKHIIKRVGELGKHIHGYETYMQKLGAALGTTVGHYNTAYKELGKIDKDVLRITGTTVGVDQTVLAKPDLKEE